MKTLSFFTFKWNFPTWSRDSVDLMLVRASNETINISAWLTKKLELNRLWLSKYSFIPKKETFKIWSPGLRAGMRNIPIGGNHENGPCLWKDEGKQKYCSHVKPVRVDMQKRVSNLEWWCVSGRASLRQVGDWLSLFLLVDVLLAHTTITLHKFNSLFKSSWFNQQEVSG